MNKNLISPISIIEDKLKQAWYGCLEFTEQKDDSVSWRIYCSAGKVQYATSTVGQQERLQYLWRVYQIETDCPQIDATKQEYKQLCRWGLERELANSDLQALLLKFTQEAITQILSLEQALVEIKENETLPETLTNFSWQDLKILQLKEEVKKWIQIRTYVNSPFSRFYLRQDNTLKFYKFWKKLSTHPNLAELANSQKVSSLVSLFSGKNCFYYIASNLNIAPLTLLECLQPCLHEGIFDLLPWQEVEKKVAASQTPVAPKLNTYSTHRAKPADSNTETNNLPLIACIDDSKTVQRQVKLTLEAIGYQVIDILDPGLALKKLSRQNPVLILMDINMPTMNGYDLCSMLRRSHKFQEIPIVMLTGRDGIIDRMRAKFVGSTDYITKPFEPNVLVELVRKLAVVNK